MIKDATLEETIKYRLSSTTATDDWQNKIQFLVSSKAAKLRFQLIDKIEEKKSYAPWSNKIYKIGYTF